MRDTLPDRLAYRVPEALYVSGLGRTKFYAEVKAGRLRLIKIGGRSLVPAEDLKALVSPSRTEAA